MPVADPVSFAATSLAVSPLLPRSRCAATTQLCRVRLPRTAAHLGGRCQVDWVVPVAHPTHRWWLRRASSSVFRLLFLVLLQEKWHRKPDGATTDASSGH